MKQPTSAQFPGDAAPASSIPIPSATACGTADAPPPYNGAQHNDALPIVPPSQSLPSSGTTILPQATQQLQQLCHELRGQPHNRNLRRRLVHLCRQHKQWNLAVDTFGWLCQQQPNDAEAWFLLGIAQHQLGCFAKAIHCFQAVIRLLPRSAEAHQNLAATYEAAGKFDEALAAYDRAIAQHPDFAAAHHGRGHVLRCLGRLNEAIDAYREAVGLCPKSRIWHAELGQLLLDAGRLREAAACFREIAQRYPAWDRAWIGLARSLAASGKTEEAIETLRTAASRSDTESPAVHRFLAELLGTASRWPEAAQVLNDALSCWPDSDELLSQLAMTYRRLGALDRALALCRRAVARRPRSSQAITQLAIAHQECGWLRRALNRYRRALQLDPHNVVAQLNRALLLLSTGKFGPGWDAYEWRWKLPQAERPPWHRLSIPHWNGEPLTDKTIFVHAEQGVGDDIMFASCFDDLLRAAKQCVFECDQRLVPLFSRSFPKAHIVGTKFADSLASHPIAAQADVQVVAGTMPRFLRRRISDFPQQRAYLIADAARVACWRQRLATLGPGLKIGISWRGGSGAEERHRRSTNLDDWVPLLRCPGVHFVNLQYGDCHAELHECMRGHQVLIHSWPQCQPLSNLDDFAALVASLDLVISVTNATVHLAGALGVPAWALVPTVATWRWMAQGDSMPWYTSVRLFRQATPGCWKPLLHNIADQLRCWVATRGPYLKPHSSWSGRHARTT